jgi:biopolymer transport protein TolQ
MSLINTIFASDFVIKSVLLLLFGSSVISWAVIFERYVVYRDLIIKMRQFEKIFWEAKSLDSLYEFTRGKMNNPLARMFVSAMEECQHLKGSTNHNLRSGTKERVLFSVNSIKNAALARAERNLSILAILGSKAPFLGLFGTVWGIMHSFQSIAASKNTSLSIVAPGIAEALFVTAVGLFVSIPAIVAYNLFADRLNKLDSIMQGFMSDLYNLFSRLLDDQSI